jgi:hypothetical protein
VRGFEIKANNMRQWTSVLSQGTKPVTGAKASMTSHLLKQLRTSSSHTQHHVQKMTHAPTSPLKDKADTGPKVNCAQYFKKKKSWPDAS